MRKFDNSKECSNPSKAIDNEKKFPLLKNEKKKPNYNFNVIHYARTPEFCEERRCIQPK